MNKTIPITQVALPVPLPTVFDYYCAFEVVVGCLVKVPFRNKILVGVVTHIKNNSDFDLKKLRHVTEVLEPKPALDKEVLQLCLWTSRYYHAPIGEVIQLALPKVLRKNQKIPPEKKQLTWHSLGHFDTVKESLKSAPQQWQLWQFIHQHQAGASVHSLRNYSKSWLSFAKILKNKNWLSNQEVVENTEKQLPQILNTEQKVIVEKITPNLEKFAVHLIYGITGSGKTEVYLHLIDTVLKRGKQVLVLVPEISLTPQTALRFQKRFGPVVETQHSKLSDTERYYTWLNGKTNKTKIIIGTRSAIFNPFENLGLIIIDEEHDSSFKQQDSVRYNARDLAIVRAKERNIPVILGSATPALESLLNAQNKNYQFHKLTQRAGGAKVSPIVIDDLNHNTNHLALSEQTLKKITLTLQKKLQVMIFINRRGFSPALYCANCGHINKCSHCDANMTVHKKPPHILCHHCGTSSPLNHECPECQNQQLVMLGEGTEKVEQQLKAIFSDKSILRIDRDTTSKKQDWQKVYEKVNSQQVDILVGTQMLAKGHHFPKVALVVVLGVDQSLLNADFRATEYLGQLLTQVSGRAGRSSDEGEAVIQTLHPNHPVLNKIINEGYLALSEDLLTDRKESFLPPYSSMCVLRTSSKSAHEALSFLQQAASLIQFSNIEVLGPIPAPMEKLAGKYRYQLIVQANKKQLLQSVCKTWLPQVYKIKTSQYLRWNLDIDPVSLS